MILIHQGRTNTLDILFDSSRSSIIFFSMIFLLLKSIWDSSFFAIFPRLFVLGKINYQKQCSYLLFFSPGHFSLYEVINVIFVFLFSFSFQVYRAHSQVVIQVCCLYLCFRRTNLMIFSDFFNVVLKVWSDIGGPSSRPFILIVNEYDTVTLWHTVNTVLLWHCDIL